MSKGTYVCGALSGPYEQGHMCVNKFKTLVAIRCGEPFVLLCTV